MIELFTKGLGLKEYICMSRNTAFELSELEGKVSGERVFDDVA